MKQVAFCVWVSLLLATAAPAQQPGANPNDGGNSGTRGKQISPLTAPGALVVKVPSSESTAAARANSPCAEPPPLVLAVVIKGRVNLRGRANIAGGVVGGVSKGSVLVIEGDDGAGSPWYRVTDVQSGKAGWIHGDVIKIAYRR